MKRRSLDTIRVFAGPRDRRRGRLLLGSVVVPCALGSGGPVRAKREGDGGTPVAAMRPRGVFFRPDRVRRPTTLLPVSRIGATDGWCDDPGSPRYNRPVPLPFPGSHERMRRDDGLYDFVVDLDWNRGPIRRGRGSAIFLHVARPGFRPTEGCIAVDRRVIEKVLRRLSPRTRIVVRG